MAFGRCARPNHTVCPPACAGGHIWPPWRHETRDGKNGACLRGHVGDQRRGRRAGSAGLGTRSDPIRITKQVLSATPITLVIRATKPINPFAHPSTHATGTLHFDITIVNASGLPWIGAEFELQEIIGQASVYGDGLSFDQRRTSSYQTWSDRFAGNQQDFEPHDRILFHDGFVDPQEQARFQFLVTDLTPVATFYIRFDPRIPAS